MDRVVGNFKNSLDKYLNSVGEQPGCGGQVGLRAAASGNLGYQMNNNAGWTQAELWRQTGRPP